MYRKLIVINFSHPLSFEVLQQVFHHENNNAAVIGYGAFSEVEQKVIPCQLDLEKPIEQQVLSILQAALPMTDDCVIVPPALAAGAFIVGRYYGYQRIVWLKREEGSTPPTFVLGGIE